MRYLLAFVIGGSIFTLALAAFSWVESNHEEHLAEQQSPPALTDQTPPPTSTGSQAKKSSKKRQQKNTGTDNSQQQSNSGGTNSQQENSGGGDNNSQQGGSHNQQIIIHNERDGGKTPSPHETTELSSISEAQRSVLKKELYQLAGNDLRLIQIGSSANTNVAHQTVLDVFGGWNIHEISVGQVSSANIADGYYLTSHDISSKLSKRVYSIFHQYGVNLPLVPDAYSGPISLGSASGIVIVLH